MVNPSAALAPSLHKSLRMLFAEAHNTTCVITYELLFSLVVLINCVSSGLRLHSAAGSPLQPLTAAQLGSSEAPASTVDACGHISALQENLVFIRATLYWFLLDHMTPAVSKAAYSVEELRQRNTQLIPCLPSIADVIQVQGAPHLGRDQSWMIFAQKLQLGLSPGCTITSSLWKGKGSAQFQASGC